MSKAFNKSKKEPRKWFNGLSAEEKNSYFNKIGKSKLANRQKKQQSEMKSLGLKYDCSNCTFGITKSCIDNFPDGCGYFFNAKTGQEGYILLAQIKS
jgi:hypothetical protein